MKFQGTITKATPMMGYDLKGDSATPTIEGYMVEFSTGHTSWVPADTFDKCFKPVSDKMTYPMALEEARAGEMITRKGWNGKGMWVEMQVPDENSKMTRPYMYICMPYGSTNQFGDDAREIDRVPWIPSQTDQLADDWMVKPREVEQDGEKGI